MKGPNSSSYTATTAANIEAAPEFNATVRLTSGPKPKIDPTVRGFTFNTSYTIVAADQVCISCSFFPSLAYKKKGIANGTACMEEHPAE